MLSFDYENKDSYNVLEVPIMKVDINLKQTVEKTFDDLKSVFSTIKNIVRDKGSNHSIDNSLLVKLAICCDTYNELLINLETTID